jgi:hypothetical protein
VKLAARSGLSVKLAARSSSSRTGGHPVRRVTLDWPIREGAQRRGKGAGVVHTPVFDTTAPPRLADQPGFGYMSSQRGNLPLEDVRLHADIAGLAASVDLRATFSNDGVDPIEASRVERDAAILEQEREDVGEHLVAGADHVTLLPPMGVDFATEINRFEQLAPALADLA